MAIQTIWKLMMMPVHWVPDSQTNKCCLLLLYYSKLIFKIAPYTCQGVIMFYELFTWTIRIYIYICIHKICIYIYIYPMISPYYLTICFRIYYRCSLWFEYIQILEFVQGKSTRNTPVLGDICRKEQQYLFPCFLT